MTRNGSFQPITVRESTVEESIEILRGLRERFEEHHRLKITDNALKGAAEMAERYITDRFMPDKAIDLIDEASSRVRMRRAVAPQSLKDAMKDLEAIQEKKDGVRALLHAERHGIRVTGRSRSETSFRLSEYQENLPHLAGGLETLAGTTFDGELVCPAAEQPQLPFLQVWFAPHRFPQLPQLAESVWMSVQVAPHISRPA